MLVVAVHEWRHLQSFRHHDAARGPVRLHDAPGYAGIIYETHTDERASSPCLLTRTRACTYGYKDIPIGTRFEQSSTSACPTRAATWVRALATPCEQLCVCTWLERLQL